MPTPSENADLDFVDPGRVPAGAGTGGSSGEAGDEAARAHSTGIAPSQDLRAMALRKEIFALEPIADDQFQPASLDLRLGPTAYRVRASFLPGQGTVKAKLDEFATHADATFWIVVREFLLEMSVGLAIGIAGAWLLLESLRGRGNRDRL